MDVQVRGIVLNRWFDRLRPSRCHRAVDDVRASNDSASQWKAVAKGPINLETIKRRLNMLPVNQRAVMVLICVHGLSYQQTASVLGMRLATVMRYLSRARHTLCEDERRGY